MYIIVSPDYSLPDSQEHAQGRINDIHYCFSRLLPPPPTPRSMRGAGSINALTLCSTQIVSGIAEALSMHPQENELALLSILSECFISIHVVKVHSRNNKHRTSSLLRSSYPTLLHTYKGKTNFFLKASIHTALALPDCAGGRAGLEGGGCPSTQLVSMIQRRHLAALSRVDKSLK